MTITPTTSPDGPTSADDAPIDHRCTLVEKHRIGARVLHENANATASRFAKYAHAWCDAHGLKAEIRVGMYAPGGREITVSAEWDVIVGKADVSADQSEPGALDSWTWSARVDHWRSLLGRFDGGREGRRLPELSKRPRNPFAQIARQNDERIASVTPLHPPLPPTCTQDEPWKDPWPS